MSMGEMAQAAVAPDHAPLTVEQAIDNLAGKDLGQRVYAAWWLGRFRVCQPAAVDGLIRALADEADRTEDGGYPLRRNAARALGKLGDRRAVASLVMALSCTDFYVREAAAQALEMLGERSAIPALGELLQHGVVGVQLQPNQPDFSQPYDAILEALGTLGAVDWQPMIQLFLAHPIPRIQFAAARALYQLTGDSLYADRLVQALSAPDLQLRRTVLADLGAIGYLPAAPAIASTLAENSLKLIALKGVLAHQMSDAGAVLSEGALQVMNLMDELL
jgi:phycocyanobilin lyase alpha subunit